MQDRIENQCEKAVHKRIVSDTIKVKNWDLEIKLKHFEKKLFKEAEKKEISTA